MNCFIYTLSDPSTRDVRYVGKTNNIQLRLRCHIADKQNTHKVNWINCLKKLGRLPVIEVLEEVDELHWKEAEMFWIESFRQFGFRLVNGTRGGDGGAILNPEVATKQRENSARANKSPEKRLAVSIARSGHKQTPEQIAVLSSLRKGKKMPKRWFESQKIAKAGIPWSAKSMAAWVASVQKRARTASIKKQNQKEWRLPIV